MDPVKEQQWMQSVANGLSDFVYLMQTERDDKGRLHVHGVIKMMPRRKLPFEMNFPDRHIGFLKLSKDPKRQWYEYMYKDYVDQMATPTFYSLAVKKQHPPGDLIAYD